MRPSAPSGASITRRPVVPEHERVERGVDRWVDDDGVAAVGSASSRSVSTTPSMTSGTIAVLTTSRSCHCQRREANSATASASAVPQGYPVSPRSMVRRSASATVGGSPTSISATHSGSTSSGCARHFMLVRRHSCASVSSSRGLTVTRAD